jgi:phage tail sheath protein FI
MFNLANGKPHSKATTLVKNYVRDTLNINSSFSGMYANYLKVYDVTNDTERWIPATGHVASQFAYTDDIAEPWYATAGLRRGRLSGVIKVAFNPNKAQRDILYPNRINSIVQFPGEGPVIMGQKTLQSFASVFDRINVRRLFNYVEKVIARFSRILIFEQNNEFLRTQFKSVVNPFLGEIVSRQGIDDFIVVADDSNNPLEKVQAHEFNATILIRPVATAEFIKIQFVAVGGTLSFQEILAGANPGT